MADFYLVPQGTAWCIICLQVEHWEWSAVSFFIPRRRSRGGGYCHHHVWPCGRASVFRFQTISLKPLAGLLSYCIQTSLRGCRCAFWSLWPLTYFFTFDFEAIIDFNWFRIISRKAFPGLFSYCTHKSLRGVDVPFGGYDLWPNFWPLISRWLLTSIHCGW